MRKIGHRCLPVSPTLDNAVLGKGYLGYLAIILYGEQIILEDKRSEAEQALAKLNAVFGEFTSFYSLLLEKGIDETEYGKVFSDMSQVFREVYTTSKKNYDALMFSRSQFEDGRLERDAFERSLTRIEQFIIGADFDIGLKILPQLKRVEKEILQKQIVNKVAEVEMPDQMKTEVKQEAEKLLESMATTEKTGNINQVEEFIGIGKKIIDLGKKIWRFAEKSAPGALPLILRIFNPA
jgi:hypothetical protein